jgi:hypothetical protein
VKLARGNDELRDSFVRCMRARVWRAALRVERIYAALVDAFSQSYPVWRCTPKRPQWSRNVPVDRDHAAMKSCLNPNV